MNNVYIGPLKRVSKPHAIKLWLTGNTLVVVPVKINPCNNWNIGTTINRHFYDPYEKETLYNTDKAIQYFKRLIDEFTYYNCNHETGYYPAFYISGV